MSDAWTIGRVVKWAADDFRTRGIASPRLDAELLLSHVLGIERIRIITDAQRPLEPRELSVYRDLIRRRRAREPIAYLRGERKFYGRPFRVDKRVLIPRPDTETLVEVALERTRARSMSGRALDLCTGSGCVAITIARERPTWSVDGTDISTDALAVARENAMRLGALWNLRWASGDLFAPVRGNRYDLITANPPYIPHAEVAMLDEDVRDHEPWLALDGGADGLALVARIVRDVTAYLRPGGVFATEVMAGQAQRVAALFEQTGLVQINVRRDYGGIDRVVSGVVSPAP